MSGPKFTPNGIAKRFARVMQIARTTGLNYVRVSVDLAETIIATLALSGELDALLRERDATVAVSQDLRDRIDAALKKAAP